MVRAIPPLVLKDHYYLSIEAEIQRILDDIIYKPLLKILGMRRQDLNREIKNSNSALRFAISQGTIWYENGQFMGCFNARISSEIIRLGGVYNVKARTYSLPDNKLPIDLKFAQAQANSRYEIMRGQMLEAINEMNPEAVDALSRAKEEYERSLTHMENDLQKTLPLTVGPKISNPSSAVSRLTIEAKLTDEQKKIIADDWGSNLDLYIKKWTEKNILKLRSEIQPHVMAGGRAEGLVKVIQDNYGVAKRKAKFLARQETALLMAKFQEIRYLDIGIQKYRWSDAHDQRVRHDHHELNGKAFRFDSPPVSNKKTGARNNPGQDYNCRCVAIPLVE